MLSVVATCRQQNRNVPELLNACCRAATRRLRRSFLTAPSSVDSGRLTGNFRARSGPSEAEKSLQIVSPELIFGRVGNSSEGGSLPILAAVARLILVPFELDARHAPGLERLRFKYEYYEGTAALSFAIPEPSTILLLFMALPAWIGSRRSRVAMRK